MASALNEESVEKKLRSVTNTQDSIQSLSLWIIHHKTHYKSIVRLWLKVFKKAKPPQRLTLFYLCNDVVQNCKRKNAIVYRESFKDIIKAAAIFARDETIKAKVERIFNIWEQRNVFDSKFIASLQNVLGNTPAKSPAVSTPPAKPATPKPSTPKQSTPKSSSSSSSSQAVVDPKLIADFKPSALLDKIRTFSILEQEVELRYRQMAHIKLDASSIEAVKQLKDKTHGKEFSQQFEDSCVKLDEYIERLDVEMTERKALLNMMETAQMFYDEQYREAKIVANAYKNFGTRISNNSKRLSDLKKTMPFMISPVPSPVMDAPSPGQTPPTRDEANMESVDMDMSDEDNGEIPSPPVDALSPPMTPEQPAIITMYQPPSKKVIGEGLDKRIQNLIPSMGQNKSMPDQQEMFSQSVYNPANKNLTSVMIQGEGGSTPLSDERCSTPVQDEVPEVEPLDEEDSTPEEAKDTPNPIDILTKLISTTQKAAPSSNESNFLQSLSLLTSTVKSHVEKLSKTKTSSETPPEDDTDGSGTPEQTEPVQPKSWAAWKAKSNPEPEASRTPPRPIPSIQSGPGPKPIATLVSEPAEEAPEEESQEQAEEEDVGNMPSSQMQQPTSVQVPQGPLPQIPQTPPVSLRPGIIPPSPQLPPPPQGMRPAGPPSHMPPVSQIPPSQPPMSMPPVMPPLPMPPRPGMPHAMPPSPVPHLAPPPPVPMVPVRAQGATVIPALGTPLTAPPPQISPPLNFMPPRLNIPPPNYVPTPNSGGFNPLSSPPHFMHQTSPGQKENWPTSDSVNQSSSPSTLVPLIGPDIPPLNQRRTPPAAEMPNPPFHSPPTTMPKSILRNSQNPVLKEVSQASGMLSDLSSNQSGSGPKPPSIPPSPTDARPPPHVSQSQPVLEPGEDLIEFAEKLKRKTAEALPEGRPRQPHFNRNICLPNLTTITPVEEVESTSNNNKESEKADSMEDGTEPIQSIQSISTLGSTVRRVDPSERPREPVSRIESVASVVQHVEPVRRPEAPPSYEHSEYRDSYYDSRRRERYSYPSRDPYRDPYSRPPPYPPSHDPYGPPPPKRHYMDHYERRRPYYRY